MPIWSIQVFARLSCFLALLLVHGTYQVHGTDNEGTMIDWLVAKVKAECEPNEKIAEENGTEAESPLCKAVKAGNEKFGCNHLEQIRENWKKEIMGQEEVRGRHWATQFLQTSKQQASATKGPSYEKVSAECSSEWSEIEGDIAKGNVGYARERLRSIEKMIVEHAKRIPKGGEEEFLKLVDYYRPLFITGAMDVIIVGEKSTTLHVHFGYWNVLFPYAKTVHMRVNENAVPIEMQLDDHGKAIFARRAENKFTAEDISKLKEHVQLDDKGEGSAVVSFELHDTGVKLTARLYFYPPGTKFIIFDIDGTISKKELGPDRYQVQDGLVELFKKIFRFPSTKSFRFIYLTNRPVTFYEYTHLFLHDNVHKKINLPNGPLLLNPVSMIAEEVLDVLIPDFLPSPFAEPGAHRKTQAMLEIESLFEPEKMEKIRLGSELSSTLIAGLGDRDTDIRAYHNVGIANVFKVNPKGELEIVHKKKADQESSTYYGVHKYFFNFPRGPFYQTVVERSSTQTRASLVKG